MKNIFTALALLLTAELISTDAMAITDALKIRIARGSYSDETIIRFVAGATNGFDGSYDAWKLFSANAAVPNIFSKDNVGDELTINAMPEFISSIIQDVFLKIGTAGTYTFSSEEPGLFIAGVKIIMKDVVTGQLYDLRTTNTYTINLPAIAQTDPARFQVFFSYPASVQIDNATCSNCADGNAAITKNGESNWAYAVVDSAGNNIVAGTASSSTQNINGLEAGDYTVTITGDFSCTDSKLFSISVTPIILGASFTDFSVVTDESTISIRWSTGMESNTDYFTVERSRDGINYESTDKITAAGNSSSARNYFSSDNHPYGGASFYKIKLTDSNGSVSYSNSLSVNSKDVNHFSVFPIPASDVLNIRLDENKGSEVILIIRDMTGREIFSAKTIPASDHESFVVEITEKFIPGIYTISASGKEKTFEQKIIIN